ncbi:19257_t:CDS:2 [Entrophospora sp. SA101]|nr:9643_t:CDS:2 [Entrophospora sp. SA101]CAJ0768656.1 19257_t:CDS:2 [Entrophospora sp. SA101]CAJ0877122.1 15551_t:CDS:2 [Entrophospora sp. SA101]CAJ0904765.1 15749_t:CDS:2 [Entrophospora sp. SA101]
MKFDGGFYNPHLWAEYEALEVTSQIEIAQETRFADEWEKHQPRLRKKLN